MNEDQILNLILERMLLRMKAAGSTPSANPAHGPGGLFGALGMPTDVINAMVSPVTGLAARMPIMLSNQISPMFSILTGQTASTGSEPTQACQDAKQPGDLEVCNQAWTFGRIVMDSQVIQADRAGEQINRGEFIDQTLIGDPFGDIAPIIPINPREALRSLTKKKILELMNAVHRDYGNLLYEGDPLNTSGSTGFIEFAGLNLLINNDYQDVLTRTRCQAADSLIVNFNAYADDADIVATLTEMYRRQNYLAERTKLLPVDFKFVMRYSLFMALTALWPCAYATYRCRTAAPNDDAMVVVDGREQQAMVSAMRNGFYLLIDDKQVEVIIDDYITESVASGTFTSDIYLVPMSIAGGRKSLYWEYFNLAGPYGMQEAITDFDNGGSHFKVLGGGRYWLHSKPPTNECLQIRLGYKPRVILEAPFLAARLTNVKYTAMFHESAWDPTDPYYFAGGGQSAEPVPYLYPPIAR